MSVRTPKGELFLTRNFIVELFVSPKEYKNYSTIRRIRTNHHLITIGFKNKITNKNAKHKHYKLLSIWHPLDEEKHCRLRDWLIETGEFAKLLGSDIMTGAKPSLPALQLLFKLKGSDIYGLTKKETIEKDLIEEFTEEEIQQIVNSEPSVLESVEAELEKTLKFPKEAYLSRELKEKLAE